MFTGIVKSVGSVKTLEEDHLLISTDDDNFYNLEPGTSISIDGCCLTLREYIDNNLLFQISDETITRTSLNKDHCGFVNMELPLTVNSLLSGHIVQGHIDTTGKVLSVRKVDRSHIFDKNCKIEFDIKGMYLLMFYTSNSNIFSYH